jgi:hypothetical protein
VPYETVSSCICNTLFQLALEPTNPWTLNQAPTTGEPGAGNLDDLARHFVILILPWYFQAT